MKVLITGSQGQVGSEVARLSDNQFRATAFDRRSLDITNGNQVRRRLDAVRPDFVVNCAAYTAVDRAEDEPELAHAVNAEAVHLLGTACAERGISVIHLSTDYVFDGRKSDPYVEEDSPNPLGTYGASKLSGEELLRAVHDRHVILRVSWVFGRLGRSFVDTILRLARERDELTVVDDQVGAPAPATAIAHAVRQIAEAEHGARGRQTRDRFFGVRTPLVAGIDHDACGERLPRRGGDEGVEMSFRYPGAGCMDLH